MPPGAGRPCAHDNAEAMARLVVRAEEGSTMGTTPGAEKVAGRRTNPEAEVRQETRGPPSTTVGDFEVLKLESFGQPWRVVPRAAFLWTALHNGKQAAMVKEGRVVGVRGEAFDHRMQLTRVLDASYRELWAVSELEGTCILQKVPGQPELHECEIAAPFRDVYAEVVSLCHKRIWLDNAETLWEGQRDRIPGRDSIEEKLFDPKSTILRASAADLACVGGAIVRSVRVPTSSPAEGKGWSTVLYVECCAAVPGQGAGQVLWQQIVRLPGVIVALHSIHVENTFAFWNACGMRCLDASNEEHRDWLEAEFFAKQGGAVGITMEDLVASLPQSSLPFFVACLPPAHTEAQDPRAIFSRQENEIFALV